MTSNPAASSAKQAKGSFKEAIGKVTGGPKIQAEGAAEKGDGEVPNDGGMLTDSLQNPASRAGAAT